MLALACHERREERAAMNPALASILRYLVVAVVGYVFGSVPSGVLVGRIAGFGDPRGRGSGKTGATNILRTMGPGAAGAVAVSDVLKGAIPVILAHSLIFPGQPWAEVLAGLAAIVGHNYSIFIGFGGGRGVATGAGASFAIQPIVVLLGLFFFAVPIILTRYVSLGSMLGAASLAVIDALFVATGHDSYPHLVFYVLTAAFIIYSHRDNVMRLLAGTERKLGQRAT
jgi:glycerol-3-phosphate acyltransferase PlsY